MEAEANRTPEQEARQSIDAQLSAAGWQVVPPGSPIGAQPTALCELTGDTGRADYVLYLDRKACGIIEAKRSDHSLQGVQEQSATYPAFRKWADPSTCWQSTLPFRFPETLIFAKTDHYADHIVRLVLDVFGKGDAFCNNITDTSFKSANV